MWKGRASAVVQKAVAQQSRRNSSSLREAHHGRQVILWPIGAALSVLLLAELDKRQKNHQEQQQASIGGGSSNQSVVKGQNKSNDDDEDTTPFWMKMKNYLPQPSQPQVDTVFTNLHEGITATTTGTMTHNTTTASCEGGSTGGNPMKVRKSADLRRFATLRRMNENSTKEKLQSRYNVNWKRPLGEGSFGAVYVGLDRTTGERVAVKKISKRYTNEDEFYREMNALLHLRKAGGHPGICSLREHFNEGGHYYLILDIVEGGEMFDHLVEQGAYSEADAARLIREVASSLLFIHGLDTTHGDLKPENLMLSSKNPSDAVVKLVDFGCAQVDDKDAISHKYNSESDGPVGSSIAGKTLAYCPPEVLTESKSGRYTMHPSMDMWALGVILYIMLTGLHPYDIRGQASDEEVAKAIVSGVNPPLRNSAITAHLSGSAIDLIEKLMDRNPKTRIDAWTLLQHPWVKGETALTSKIALAGKKLSMYSVYKSGIERRVFEKLVTSSGEIDEHSKKSSLIEKSFRMFDEERKGHIDLMDLQSVGRGVSIPAGADERDAAPMSLSTFSDLLSEHMQNKYFPKGHVVYREGEMGNQMYFISSGTITVSTKTGFTVARGPGDFFGEGALLSNTKRRSATVHCNTPVHAMEVSREYFDKYLAKSDSALFMFLREKDIIRKKNRAKVVLRNQQSLNERHFQFDEILFDENDKSDTLFLVEQGVVDILVSGKHVFTANPGNICGENAALTGRARSAKAICATKEGCIAYEMAARDFKKLMKKAPDLQHSLRTICLRRDFKKAVVKRLNKEFPYLNPREAFNSVKTDMSHPDYLSRDEIANLVRDFSPSYTDKEVDELVKMLDLTHSNTVSFDEFKQVFIVDIKASASK